MMNRVKMLTAAGAAVASVAAFAGGTFEVHTVDDLTNALSHVQGNVDTTIKIHPGTYYVGDRAMTTESHIACVWASGSSGVGKRRIYGLGAKPSETVIVGKGMYSGSGKRVFTGDNMTMVSNLTITGGCRTGTGGGISTAGLGVWNCVISNNYATSSGGGTDSLSAYNCLYAYNVSKTGHGGGGRFSDSKKTENCTFATNSCPGASNANGGGVSLGTHTGSTFIGNTAAGGGGAHSATLIGCTFIDNHIWASGGGAAIGGTYGSCTATNCTFKGNTATNNVDTGWTGEVANSTVFDDCAFEDHLAFSAGFGRCTLRRCDIRRLTSSRVHVDMFYKCGLYNTLLVDMEHTHTAGSVATLANECNFYNCTVVGYTNLSVNANYIMQAGNCKAVNTIFTQTQPAGFGADYTLVMTNCLWTEQKTAGDLPKAVGGGLIAPSELKFTDAAKGDYTLRHASKARNAGWSDAAYRALVGPVDLAGNARIYMRDGEFIIDVGCYEYSQSDAGMVIFMK